MPRRPRYYLPGVACHVVQRGHNKDPCFFSDQDRRLYLGWLKEAATRHECAIHAYVLMTNHVHLLMTPRWTGSVSLTLHSVAGRYVRYINSQLGRSGTLWEGRHWGSLIDSETYFFTCCRYIELNPLRAGMVGDPKEYAWSSYRRNALGIPDPLVTEHAEYLGLGQSDEERLSAYRELFKEELECRELESIRVATSLGVPLGSDRFRSAVDAKLDQKVSYRRRGRPKQTLLHLISELPEPEE